jgi:hypothetical protein
MVEMFAIIISIMIAFVLGLFLGLWHGLNQLEEAGRETDLIQNKLSETIKDLQETQLKLIRKRGQ